jgi:hypothetical protein
LGELLFEFGCAEGSAAVEGLVEADLLAGVPEQVLAGRQAARGGGRQGIEGAALHSNEYAKSADAWAGQ